ncbi:hypothetical protein ACCO45_010299 [Purpureocillium lilacinum]|uniref:Uncharacterized protein n=1 Tax=Purpureocillium lilacinum TaxID=33203 RepID=A0ACC4DEF5_PURLI
MDKGRRRPAGRAAPVRAANKVRQVPGIPGFQAGPRSPLAWPGFGTVPTASTRAHLASRRPTRGRDDHPHSQLHLQPSRPWPDLALRQVCCALRTVRRPRPVLGGKVAVEAALGDPSPADGPWTVLPAASLETHIVNAGARARSEFPVHWIGSSKFALAATWTRGPTQTPARPPPGPPAPVPAGRFQLPVWAIDDKLLAGLPSECAALASSQL